MLALGFLENDGFCIPDMLYFDHVVLSLVLQVTLHADSI